MSYPWSRVVFVVSIWRLMRVFKCPYSVAVSIFCDALLLNVQEGDEGPISARQFRAAAYKLGYGLVDE